MRDDDRRVASARVAAGLLQRHGIDDEQPRVRRYGPSRGETAGNGGGGGGAVLAFLDALASGSGASRRARASASDSNAAIARSGFVFLRSDAEPVQQASRTGGSLVENAQGVDADAQPVHHVIEWAPCSAPACRSARPPHTAHFGSRPKQSHPRRSLRESRVESASGRSGASSRSPLRAASRPWAGSRSPARYECGRISHSPLALARWSAGHSSGPRRRRK